MAGSTELKKTWDKVLKATASIVHDTGILDA